MAKAKAAAPVAPIALSANLTVADLEKLVAHPLTIVTPEMPSDQIDALAQDIKRNGLKDPITLYEGKILDGRARVKASIKAGLPAAVITLPAGSPPRAYVYSKNVHRRQLSGVQLARVAANYMNDNKGQKLTQDEVADLFGLGAKTLRYVLRALTSGQDHLVKLVENPETTRGELRLALVAAGLTPDRVAAEDIGGDLPILPAPHKDTQQAASADVDDLLGTGSTTPSGATVNRATAPQASNVGHGQAAAKAAVSRPSAASVTHVATMASLVDTLAKSTAQDLEAFYKAAVQRGVWARLSKVHADNVARMATDKAKGGKTTAKA